MPRIAPDLTATLYGGRIALAKIAAALGKEDEGDFWRERAEMTRIALMKYCFDPESNFFYDRDCNGFLVKIAGDAGLRVLMEHVPDQAAFEQIFQRWIINPNAFWTPYPLPSVAACDPTFIYPPPVNCWGGACQTLLALRAPRWLEYYGKYSALDHLMKKYLEAFKGSDEFRQQMDPYTGKFSSGAVEYSPTMCCVIDFITRMAGVLQTTEGISWGCGGISGTEKSSFAVDLYRGRGTAELELVNSVATARLNGREIAQITGPVRLFSGDDGKNLKVVALADCRAVIQIPGQAPSFPTLLADESFSF